MNQQLDVLIDVPCFSCMFWKSDRENHLLCKPAECEELTKWLDCLVKLMEAESNTSGIEVVPATVPGQTEIREHKRTINSKKRKQAQATFQSSSFVSQSL